MQCSNTDCAQHEVLITVPDTLPPDMPIMCGTCNSSLVSSDDE
jgi:hypothetical protein